MMMRGNDSTHAAPIWELGFLNVDFGQGKEISSLFFFSKVLLLWAEGILLMRALV
jgi:hypothetical protein